MFGRIFLVLFGFHRIHKGNAVLTRGKPSGYSLGERSLVPSKESLILTNHVSFIDVLYLTMRFSPTFALISNDYDEIPTTVTVHPMTPWKAMQAVRKQSILPNDKGIHLSTLLEKSKEPVVCFMEGATTNGLGMLLPVTQALDVNPAVIFPIAFRYSPSSDCIHTVDTSSQIIFKLLGQWSHSLSVFENAPLVNSLHPRARSKVTPATRIAMSPAELIEHLRGILCDSAKIPATQVNLLMKAQFKAFYAKEKEEKKKV